VQPLVAPYCKIILAPYVYIFNLQIWE
jgi:hypothetical protein